MWQCADTVVVVDTLSRGEYVGCYVEWIRYQRDCDRCLGVRTTCFVNLGLRRGNHEISVESARSADTLVGVFS